MISVKVGKEWLEILEKLASNKRMKLSEFIERYVLKEEECLNLPYIEPSGYKKINLNIAGSEEQVENAIKFYLFCISSQ